MSLSPSRLLSESLQTFWPAACAACDRPIPDEALFCAACNLSINPLVGACPGCALPIGGSLRGRRSDVALPDLPAGAVPFRRRDRRLRIRRGAGRGAGADEARRAPLSGAPAGAIARRAAGRARSRAASSRASDAVVAVPLHAHKLARARVQSGAGAGALGAGRPRRARPRGRRGPRCRASNVICSTACGRRASWDTPDRRRASPRSPARFWSATRRASAAGAFFWSTTSSPPARPSASAPTRCCAPAPLPSTCWPWPARSEFGARR